MFRDLSSAAKTLYRLHPPFMLCPGVLSSPSSLTQLQHSSLKASGVSYSRVPFRTSITHHNLHFEANLHHGIKEQVQKSQ